MTDNTEAIISNLINSLDSDATATDISNATDKYSSLKSLNENMINNIKNTVNNFTQTSLADIQKDALLEAQNESSKFNFLEKYLFLIIKIILFVILLAILFMKTRQYININIGDLATRATTRTAIPVSNSTTSNSIKI
mgnify:CR=1 FL=1